MSDNDFKDEIEIIRRRKFGITENTEEILKRIEACRLAGGNELDLCDLGMTEIPGEIENFKNLTVLNVSRNELHSLPEWLGSMTNLRELDISENTQIKSLPDNFNRLCNLETLHISDTNIVKVPQYIREFKKLKILSLGYVYLENKPITVGQWIGELSKLESLYLFSVKNIPESICNLQNLKRLEIKYSKITTLPKSIGKLSTLKELTIECCRYFREMPSTIGELASLEKLELWGIGERT
jgi:Leucine-rich repeat (LRR) protein